MPIIKKLTFAPLFLLSFAFLIYQLNPLFASTDIIFSLSVNTLIQLVILSGSILITSLFFALFVSLSQNWKIILPVAILASILPVILIGQNLGLILTIGTIISLILSFLTLDSSLKSYLTFQPTSILGPSIRNLSTLLVITISLAYFLSINKVISEQGFQIPDALIDTAINLAGSQTTNTQETSTPTLPQISKEQIELLKKNPDLLKQYGLDPKILDTYNQPQNTQKSNPSTDLIKQTVKNQLDNIIKPYKSFIPAILALLLFITLTSIVSFLTLLIYPILWLIFYTFEKSEFLKFITEMRPVKKMVV